MRKCVNDNIVIDLAEDKIDAEITLQINDTVGKLEKKYKNNLKKI